ncbi:hypothetical protein YC2023_097246 [Brassica napus]
MFEYHYMKLATKKTSYLYKSWILNLFPHHGYQIACGGKCNVRCSKASQHEECLKYCNICCEKCNGCVPSGTYGNKDECPCYRDIKNSKGGPKCP